MRRFLRWALAYAIFGLAAGVFFREFTRFNAYTGVTTLSVVHGHLLGLGMAGFLLATLLEGKLNFSQSRFCRPFLISYNTGLILTAAMMLFRGVQQILGLPDTAAISGIAGVGHIILAAGILFLFAALFNSLPQTRKAKS